MTRTSLLIGAAALLLSFGLAGCGDNGTGDDVASASGGESGADEEGEPHGSGTPADLAAHDVCALLDEATIEGHLGTEVIEMRVGDYQADCQWAYRSEGGTLTNLQVQVMTASQTGDRLGTEALEWAMQSAPSDAEIVEVDSLGAPNRSYEFSEATVIFAVDSVGRLVTVSASSETPEHNRVALTEAVLDALAQSHS